MKDDLIRRQDAIDALLKEVNAEGAFGYIDAKDAEMVLISLPSAERKKGKWIKVLEADETGNATYECPFCHRGEVHCPIVEVKFCWNCGAEMKGEDDAEVH